MQVSLQNNVLVPTGRDVTIDISSLSLKEPVFCVLAPGGEWSKVVQICSKTPPICGSKSDRYRNRARFRNTTTLEIQDVRPDESGIYRCKTGLIRSSVLISGIIVVGKFSFINLLMCINLSNKTNE